MYTAHFRLTEPPFALTPDPRFLYLGERHREALAHLLYGVGHDGGFVQLTGEIGTGKTTVCRYLLEQLPPQVDAALILNPRLTSHELLAAVCDELGAPYPRGATSVKLLVDALNQYLLEAHSRGRRTVLIIDEAQNLTPEVLEQVRLLTNLETATQKLLQIVLIGQPELSQVLDRKELRQLAQRVTARYHLIPFSRDETRDYVRHRLQVAGRREPLFTAAALNEAHRRSGGVPRLINIICDRALLGAYASDQALVDARTVRRAVSEVRGRATSRSRRLWRWVPVGALAVLVAGVGVLVGPERLERLAALGPSGARPIASLVRSEPPMQLATGVPEGEERPHGTAVSASVTPAGESNGLTPPTRPQASLAALLRDPALGSDKRTAFVRLFARWGLDFGSTATPTFACDFARANGLHCLFRTGAWARVQQLNLPVVLELTAPGGALKYVTVTALDRRTATLDFGGREFTLALGEVDLVWDGSFIALWKAPGLRGGQIAPGQRGRDVVWLRQRLDAVDGVPFSARMRDVFDPELVERVKAFQRSRFLEPDGIVGEETLAHLSGAARDGAVPVLSAVGF